MTRVPLLQQFFPETADDPMWTMLASFGIIGASVLLLFLLRPGRGKREGRR